MNAAKHLWGYNSYQEAKRYVSAYFPGEVDVTYDPSRCVTRKNGRYVLPTITSYEKCMIARMFFHAFSNRGTMGLLLGRHRTTIKAYLKE